MFKFPSCLYSTTGECIIYIIANVSIKISDSRNGHKNSYDREKYYNKNQPPTKEPIFSLHGAVHITQPPGQLTDYILPFTKILILYTSMADVSWLLELPAPSDICTQIVSKTLFYLFVSCRLITTSQRFLVFQVLQIFPIDRTVILLLHA